MHVMLAFGRIMSGILMYLTLPGSLGPPNPFFHGATGFQSFDFGWNFQSKHHQHFIDGPVGFWRTSGECSSIVSSVVYSIVYSDNQSSHLTTSISTTLITTIIYNLTNLLTNSPVYLVIEQNVKSPRQMFFALTCWNYHRLLAAVVLFDLMLLFVSNNFSPSSQFSHHCTSDKN